MGGEVGRPLREEKMIFRKEEWTLRRLDRRYDNLGQLVWVRG